MTRLQEIEARVKAATGKWSAVGQDGPAKRCFQAQVFGPDGAALATIEPTENEADATAIANLISKAPTDLSFLLEAVKQGEELQGELVAALQEIEAICSEDNSACRKRMGTRAGNALVTARAALSKARALLTHGEGGE